MANHYLNILPIRLEIIIEQLEKLKETQMVDALNAYHKSMLEELKEKTNQEYIQQRNTEFEDKNKKYKEINGKNKSLRKECWTDHPVTSPIFKVITSDDCINLSFSK